MGITAAFTARQVQTYIREAVLAQNQAIKNRLIRIGNRYVIDARTKADFTDRTGNLRSSIGFVLMQDGTQVHSNFETSARGSEREKGKLEGFAIANNLAEEYMRGFVLVVVAGMEYAASVESQGKDVITGSSIEAKNSLQRYFTAR